MLKPLTWLAAPILAVVLVVALVVARMLTPHATAPASSTASPGFAADIVIPPGTMAAPDFTLRDQAGQQVSVSQLRGRVLAITFLDSHCKQLCPLEGDQLGQVQRSLGQGVPLTLLVVSVAPETDTPDSARTFASSHGWRGDWRWLFGTRDQLAPIWKAYSIAVQPQPDEIVHSTILFLIDKRGYQRAGFAAGLEPGVVTRDVRILTAA